MKNNNATRLVLIQPPLSSDVYPDVPFPFEPLSLIAIASLTPRPEFEIRILDGCAVKNLDDLVDPEADLVGMTVVDATSGSAYQLAARYRALKIPVILGGAHVTLNPDEAVQHGTALVGEAEEGWAQVLDDFRANRLGKRYRFNRPQEIHVKMDHGVIPKLKSRYPMISPVQTTRGCAHSCPFCVPIASYGRVYRHRPVEDVVEEVKTLREKYGRRWIGFTDDNFAGDRAYTRALLEALIPLKINWAAQMCLDFAEDDAFVGLAIASGCRGAFIGLESPDQKTLDAIGKPYTTSAYPALITKLRGRGLAIIASFTIGYDWDDDGVYDRIVEFCRRTEIEFPLFVGLMAYHGTPMYVQLKRQGRLLPETDTHPLSPNFKTARLDYGQIQQRIAKMYKDYYNARYVWTMLRHHLAWKRLPNLLQLGGMMIRYLPYVAKMGRGRFLRRLSGRPKTTSKTAYPGPG